MEYEEFKIKITNAGIYCENIEDLYDELNAESWNIYQHIHYFIYNELFDYEDYHKLNKNDEYIIGDIAPYECLEYLYNLYGKIYLNKEKNKIFINFEFNNCEYKNFVVYQNNYIFDYNNIFEYMCEILTKSKIKELKKTTKNIEEQIDIIEKRQDKIEQKIQKLYKQIHLLEKEKTENNKNINKLYRNLEK